MTRLPTLQRAIARYLASTSNDLSYDVISIGIVEIVIHYLTEQSYKKTEISVEDFVCANIKDDDAH